MNSFVVNLLVALAPIASAIAGSPAPATPAPTSSLKPIHFPAPQVTGCRLVGRAFGTLIAGGDVMFKGSRYEVSESHGTPNRIVYTGPKMRAVFTPKRGGSILEGDDGVPNRVGRDARGTLRIEIEGSLVTTDAREHCVWFE